MISKNLNKIEDVSNYLELSEFSEDLIFKFGGQEQEQCVERRACAGETRARLRKDRGSLRT